MRKILASLAILAVALAFAAPANACHFYGHYSYAPQIVTHAFVPAVAVANVVAVTPAVTTVVQPAIATVTPSVSVAPAVTTATVAPAAVAVAPLIVTPFVVNHGYGFNRAVVVNRGFSNAVVVNRGFSSNVNVRVNNRRGVTRVRIR